MSTRTATPEPYNDAYPYDINDVYPYVTMYPPSLSDVSTFINPCSSSISALHRSDIISALIYTRLHLDAHLHAHMHLTHHGHDVIPLYFLEPYVEVIAHNHSVQNVREDECPDVVAVGVAWGG
jgi:hypothetical protein